jgi:hypothetical protein
MLLLLLALVMCDGSSAAGGVHSVLLVPRRTGIDPTCRLLDIWVNMHELCTTSLRCTVHRQNIWSIQQIRSSHQTPCSPQS